jgi:hypothetical protein
MSVSDTSFEEIVLRTTVWAEMQARQILEKGCTLNEHGIELARRAGVQHPEEVLLLPVASLPIPEEADLKQATQEFGLLTPNTQGLTIGYNILLLQNCLSDALLAHQLVHVAQYENCEGIPGFFEKYLSELNKYGYLKAPMVQEALAFAAGEYLSHKSVLVSSCLPSNFVH